MKLGANSSICGIQNSHQNRSKNKLVREKTVTRAHGSCSLRVMGSWIRLLPQKQLEDFYIKVIVPSVTYGLTVWGSCNKTHLNNLEKLRARAGRIVYGLPWDTSAEDVLMPTGWDSLETMYKLRLTEFVFKCLKGYTVTEFKDLFFRGIQAAEEMRTSFFQDQKQILSGTPYALEEQSHGTL